MGNHSNEAIYIQPNGTKGHLFWGEDGVQKYSGITLICHTRILELYLWIFGG